MGPVGRLVQNRGAAPITEDGRLVSSREVLTKEALEEMVEETTDRLTIIIDGPGYDDLMLPYLMLRKIYQQLTNSILVLNKPLLDVHVLLRPQFCNLPLEGDNISPGTPVFRTVELEEERGENPLPARVTSLPNFPLRRFQRVGIGGTFDHLHAGHKLMLSVAAMLAGRTLLCGITAPGGRMLEGKHYQERIESWEERVRRVQEFLCEFCPRDIQTEIIQLNDPFGPTISDATLEALIVSPETYAGGEASNTSP